MHLHNHIHAHSNHWYDHNISSSVACLWLFPLLSFALQDSCLFIWTNEAKIKWSNSVSWCTFGSWVRRARLQYAQIYQIHVRNLILALFIISMIVLRDYQEQNCLPKGMYLQHIVFYLQKHFLESIDVDTGTVLYYIYIQIGRTYFVCFNHCFPSQLKTSKKWIQSITVIWRMWIIKQT